MNIRRNTIQHTIVVFPSPRSCFNNKDATKIKSAGPAGSWPMDFGLCMERRMNEVIGSPVG